jgi:hypothetical protein
VLEEKLPELALRPQPCPLLVGVDGEEVLAQRRDPFAIDLLPAADRTVPFARRVTARPFDAGAPRELLDARQREEVVEGGVAAEASGVRTAGPDAWRLERERGQRPVDVLVHTGGRATDEVAVRREQEIGNARDDRALVGREETRHDALASQKGRRGLVLAAL